MTLEQLAAATGSNHTTISRLETGKRRLTKEWMLRLARVLECDPAEFLVDGDASMVEKASYAWAKRLNDATARRGWTKAELARRAGIEYDALSKYMSGYVHQPRGDNIARLARALGLSPLWLRDGQGAQWAAVPVIGYARGADSWVPIDDHAPGAGYDDVTFGIDGDDPVAIEVRGVSMAPVYRAGDCLICDRRRGDDFAAIVLRDCVVLTRQDERLIKIVAPGSRRGVYRLRSYNPDYPDIEDAELAWAAPIAWIRRGARAGSVHAKPQPE